MRVLLDTNVYISYLLIPSSDGPIAQSVVNGLEGVYTLLVPSELIEELERKVTTKSYLVKRISPEMLIDLVNILRHSALLLPAISLTVPKVSRDPEDDYLLAHAIMAGADVLVTGDGDLLVLDPLDSLRILTPQVFLKVLDQS